MTPQIARAARVLLTVLLGSLAAAPALAQSSQPGGTQPAVEMTSQHPMAAFTVWQLAPGAAAESQVTPGQLNPGGYWLLVYLDLDSPSSLELAAELQALAALPPAKDSSPGPIDASRLVFLAAHATGAQLTRFSQHYPALAAAAWTHDDGDTAARVLRVHGAPHLFGMREMMQRWEFAGAPSPALTASAVTTWLGQNRLPPNSLQVAPQPRANVNRPVQTLAPGQAPPQ